MPDIVKNYVRTKQGEGRGARARLHRPRLEPRPRRDDRGGVAEQGVQLRRSFSTTTRAPRTPAGSTTRWSPRPCRAFPVSTSTRSSNLPVRGAVAKQASSVRHAADRPTRSAARRRSSSARAARRASRFRCRRPTSTPHGARSRRSRQLEPRGELVASTGPGTAASRSRSRSPGAACSTSCAGFPAIFVPLTHHCRCPQ